MKKLLFLFSCTTALFCIGNVARAQSVSDSTDIIPKTEIVIPPLADLIDSALKYNASIKFRVLDIEAKDASLKSEKNYWTRNLGVQADSRYGTFDNFSTNNNGINTTNFITNSKQLNYGFGVYMKFPIIDIVDRKNQIKRANAELDQAKSMAEVQQDEVRQLIIRQYQDVLLKQKLLNLNAHALGNSKINSEMVETEFRNGLIQVSEYVRILDIVSRVETDYEKAKTEFITAKMILEDMVGFTFKNIPSNK